MSQPEQTREAEPSQASQASPASEMPPIALRVPPEIWAMVHRHVRYSDLKRFGGVCKDFQKLIQAPRYSLRLFRKKPTGTLQARTKLAIHPMLDKVNCVGQKPDIAEITLYRRGDWDQTVELNGFNYAAADEFATAPACTKMKLEMNERKCGSVSNVNGITVRQVIKAALKYWNGNVTGAIASRVRAEWEWPSDHPVTRLDTLGEHRFFERWNEAHVGADGTVFLHADWFGS